jgi:hypothetical protein
MRDLIVLIVHLITTVFRLARRGTVPSSPKADLQAQRHCIPRDCRVVAKSILGGLQHEYRLQKIAALGFKTPESIFCGRQR